MYIGDSDPAAQQEHQMTDGESGSDEDAIAIARRAPGIANATTILEFVTQIGLIADEQKRAGRLAQLRGIRDDCSASQCVFVMIALLA